MAAFTRRAGVRQAVMAVAPAALAARLLPAQAANPHSGEFPVPGVRDETRLPNGKLQRDEILKADYEQNMKDARDLVDLAKSFELDLEKSDRFVLSVGLLKKLDDIEKLTRKIRGRMKR
ncbi:MAG: hypothetical protein ABUS49_08245 [Acidobacteriota bacterium]